MAMDPRSQVALHQTEQDLARTKRDALEEELATTFGDRAPEVMRKLDDYIEERLRQASRPRRY